MYTVSEQIESRRQKRQERIKTLKRKMVVALPFSPCCLYCLLLQRMLSLGLFRQDYSYIAKIFVENSCVSILIRQRQCMCNVRKPNRPLEWTGRHQLSAAPKHSPCLPLRGSIRRLAGSAESCLSAPSDNADTFGKI